MALSSLSNIVPALTSELKNAATSDIGALVNNASKYGTSVATNWANSIGVGDLTNFSNLNVQSISGLAQSNLTGLTSGLTSNIQNLDLLGKASQFATGFSNPFTNLSDLGNFSLSSLPDISSLTNGLPSIGSLSGDLSGYLTAGLPDIGGLTNSLTTGLTSTLTGSLGELTSSLTGSLGSLTSFANLGSLDIIGIAGGLFGGGGDSLVSATKVAAGYSNTVNRSVVDTAFVQLLGSPKIPVPQFDFPSAGSTSLGALADIATAQNILQGIRSSGTGFGVVGGGFGGGFV